MVTLASGCEDRINLDPLDERPVVESSVRPRAISGGTLIVTSDGMAVAADSDRDQVHVVSVSSRRLRHTIALQAGDEPGRVAQGSEHLVHVVLRGYGGVATIDTADGTLVARRALCPDPRGIAYEASTSTLHVACADGMLLHLDELTGEELGRTELQPDLRDVVLVGGQVQASRFREASLTGAGQYRRIIGDIGTFAPAVAWRTMVSPTGEVVMLHQLASKEPVPTEPKPDDMGDGGDLPYGGGGGFCEPGIASAGMTRFTAEGTFTFPIPQAQLAVDMAISPTTGWIALAMPGAPEGSPTVAEMPPEEGGCFLGDSGQTEEQVVAVAYDDDGTLVMQSREPARLLIREGRNEAVVAVDLPGESRYDTGHEIFHRATDSGLSCATCHPEGTDDGHVWVFEGLGKRRTQSLDVGLAESAPFHWDGEMTDLGVLVEEVLAHRMGGKRQSKARSESFMRWVFEQRRPPANAGIDDLTLVQQGEALFDSLDCSRCHTGAELGGSMTTPVRSVELQVPSLHRVSLRPPFMHDGRSPTLEAAVQDMIESTTSADVRPEDVAALSAYMRTL